MTWIIHFTSVFISLSTSRSLYCTWCDGSSQLHTFSWSKKKKTENNSAFLRMEPNVFFFFFVGSYKVWKLNISTSSGNLFSCKQVLYSEPFRSGQETKLKTSFGHWVKKPEGGEGDAVWLESENEYAFKACVLQFSDGSSSTAELNCLAIQAAPVGA